LGAAERKVIVNRSTAGIATLALVAAVVATWRAFALFGNPLAEPAAAPTFKRPDTTQAQRPAATPAAVPVRPVFSRFEGTSPAQSGQARARAGTASTALPRLVGVIADGDNRIAVIAHQGVIVRAREQMRVGEWTVVRIEPRSALIRTTTKSEMLWLDPARSKDADSMTESQ
jgi:hypothetical protein